MVDGTDLKATPRWWAIPALLVGGLIGWLVSKIGPIAMAEAAGFSASVFLVVLRVLWRHRRKKWFWPSMALTVLAHVTFIAFFPWPRTHQFEKADLLFIWVDLFIYLGIGFVFERLNPRLEL